jgi:DNA polymerase I
MSEIMDIEEAQNDDSVEIGSMSITGYHCVKSNFSTITKETQREVLEAIVRDEPEGAITDIVFDAVNRIDANNPDWTLIGIPGGLGKSLGEYNWTDGSPQGAHPRAAYFGEKFLDGNYDDGDSLMRAYVHPVSLSDESGDTHQVDVIGYEYENDLQQLKDDLRLDVSATQEKTIINPLEDILDAVGIDVHAAVKGQSQESLANFI